MAWFFAVSFIVWFIAISFTAWFFALSFMAWFFVILLLPLAIGVWYLRRAGLERPDDRELPPAVKQPSEAHQQVIASLREFSAQQRKLFGKAKLRAMRDFLDSMSDGREFSSTFTPVDADGVKGEWVVAPRAAPERRILYIHGGAWVAGSPRSHRAITNKLANLARACVFSVDYRLMPEHRYMDGVVDCRNAYQWILENGPEGQAVLDLLVVGGDSAGGSLALSLVAWVRDQGLRRPDAVVAFSPSTDFTLTSPSLRGNLVTDPMLGPAFGKLKRVPVQFLWWATGLAFRVSPSNPVASPLHGDLSGLPPMLIQASEAEMLLDDSQRYVEKAQAAGSPVVLQTWPHMVHVWQFFTPEMPEAEQAYERIGEFLDNVEQVKKHQCSDHFIPLLVADHQ